MKKYFSIIFFCIILSSLKAQTNVYHPFPDTNVIWVEGTDNYANQPCDVYDDYNLFFDGDTIIGSYAYKKLLKSGHKYSNCPPPGWYYYNQPFGIFRQDSSSKKVFLFINGKDSLLYDFNLNVGDTLPPSLNNPIGVNNIIGKIDSILIGISYHKRFWVTASIYINYASIIEGIGSTFGLLNLIVPQGWYPIFDELWCVQINNQTVFPDSSYNCSLLGVEEVGNNATSINIFPNPSTGTFTLSSSEKISAIEITDILGNKIKQLIIGKEQLTIDLSEKAKGIYFVKVTDEKGNFAVRKIVLQ